MKLEQLHKRLAMQAMNPKDKLADIKAKAIGWNVQGKFQSLAERVTQMYGDAPNSKSNTVRKKRKKPSKKTDYTSGGEHKRVWF